MKSIIIAVFFLFCGLCPAQNSSTSSKAEVFNLKEPETYVLDSLVYTFTPETNGIIIRKLDNKKELDFGKLQKTTDDGLYLMTSITSKEVSFGRFDSLGNFKTIRYDPATDTVLEEYYKKTQPGLKK